MYEKLFAVDKIKDQIKHSTIATITIADLYANQGYYDKAIKTCENILEKEPNNKKVIQRLMELRHKTSSSNIAKKSRPIKKEYKSGDVISTLHVWLGDITKYKDWRKAVVGNRALSDKCDNNETKIAHLEGWLKNIRSCRRPQASADLIQSCNDDVDAKVSRLSCWLTNIRKPGQSHEVARDAVCKSGISENNDAKISRLNDLLKLVRAKKLTHESAEFTTAYHISAGEDNDTVIRRLHQWLTNVRSLRRTVKTNYCPENNSRAEYQPKNDSPILRLENWLGQIKRLQVGRNGLC